MKISRVKIKKKTHDKIKADANEKQYHTKEDEEEGFENDDKNQMNELKYYSKKKNESFFVFIKLIV